MIQASGRRSRTSVWRLMQRTPQSISCVARSPMLSMLLQRNAEALLGRRSHADRAPLDRSPERRSVRGHEPKSCPCGNRSAQWVGMSETSGCGRGKHRRQAGSKRQTCWTKWRQHMSSEASDVVCHQHSDVFKAFEIWCGFSESNQLGFSGTGSSGGATTRSASPRRAGRTNFRRTQRRRPHISEPRRGPRVPMPSGEFQK